MATSKLGDLIYAQVQAHKQKKADWRKEYQNIAAEMPSLIRFNGLTAALAFVEAKAKKDEAAAKPDSAYICYLGDFRMLKGRSCLTWASFGDAAQGSSYRLAVRVAYAQAEWFKRLSQSALDTSDDDSVTQEVTHA